MNYSVVCGPEQFKIDGVVMPTSRLEIDNIPDMFSDKVKSLELWLQCQLSMISAILYSYAFGAIIYNNVIEMNRMYIKATSKVIQNAYESLCMDIHP